MCMLPATHCARRLYNYIDRDVFEGVTNVTLWEKRKRRKHRYRQVSRISLKNKGSRSIEERPERVNKRLEYGHWEGDSIVGRRNGRKDALFTLSERMTREQIILKIDSATQESILKALNKLEHNYGSYFREKFKSITLDNGREFLDWESIEQSRLSGKKRTLVYFAHPYSSWERGTNENQNRMIRRFIPKGADISKLSDREAVKTMSKKVIVAKFTHEGKEYVGKREVKMYDESSKVDDTLLRDANQGLTLRTQTAVRNAVKAKYGLGAITTAGESVDLSAVETV